LNEPELITLPGCPVCEGTSSRPKYHKFGLPLVECRGCGLVFANPRLTPEEIWKRYSPDYFWNEYMPALGVRDGQFDLNYFDSRHAAMLQLIARQRPNRGRLLEVGAGSGFFLKAAERAGWSVAGIEISTEGVEFATKRLGLEIRRESAEALSFPAASFDVVVMFDVIEHLLDLMAALERVKTVLRPGGLLVVSTPNLHALTRLALGSEWAVLSPAEHLYNFSAATLGRLLRRAGFGEAAFERHYAGLGVYETMNPRYTHAPSSVRNKIYSTFVSTAGHFVYRQVQSMGAADVLLCTATLPV
jgi:SAM-dependent methyltransferase